MRDQRDNKPEPPPPLQEAGRRRRILLIGLGAVILGVGLWAALMPQDPNEQNGFGRENHGLQDLAANAPVKVPTFDVVRVSREGTGVIAGRAAPGVTVSILADGVALSDVQADHRGDWALIFDSPLPRGGTLLTLQSKDASGMIASEEEVILSVPMDSTPHTVTRDGFVDPVDEGVVAVRLRHSIEDNAPLTLEQASEVLQRPSASADYLSDVTLDAVDYDTVGSTLFVGRGKRLRLVRIYLDNQYKGEVTVGENGRWVFPIPKALPEERYLVRLDQIGAKGEVEARIELTLEFPRQNVEVVDDYVISETKTEAGRVWNISHKRSDGSLVYTQVITPDRAQIRDGSEIYPGQRQDKPSA